MGRKRLQTTVLCIAVLLAGNAVARAELGSTGNVSVGLGVSAGFQTDSRGCDTAGSSRSVPATGQCILFAGGVEGSILWRGHIGVALGVWSVSGQAAYTPEGQNGAAFPDRVSVPLLLDMRPLSFALPSTQNGYLSRFFYGLRLGIGPSLEFVRTSSDSSIDWGNRINEPVRTLIGMHVSLDAEIPLQSSPSGFSLRFSTRILYVPIVVLNEGAVQSTPVVSTDQTPADLATMFQGYSTQVQVYLGLVYYL